MESLQVRTGQISLKILDDNGDVRGIFKFNPDDIESAKRVRTLQLELATKETELEEKANKCETEDEKVDFLCETVHYFRGVIDKCFGEGTSDILFGDACCLDMFADFFNGISPYYEKASKARLAKYKQA